jgi:hypothetical protein
LIGCAFKRFSGAVAPEAHSNGPAERRVARYFAECARGRELLITSSAAVPRAAIDEVGPFEDLPGNEDVELWARLALHGPVAVSSKQTVNYRVDSGGITDQGAQNRKSAEKPTRREQLSSTIPTLERALQNVADARLRQDIDEYIDSRIGIRMAAAVLDGDIAYARRLLKLFKGKPIGQARRAAMIARLPSPLARALVTIRSRAKRLLARP